MSPNPNRATSAGRVFNDLRNMARNDGRSTDELLVLYVLERFLYRVSQSKYCDRLVLKGGLLLAVLAVRRTTRDADLLAVRLDMDAQEVVHMVGEIASIEIDDGVIFDSHAARTETIRLEGRYSGVRVVVPTSVGKAKVKLALDINFGDPITPGAVLNHFPQLLNDDTFPLFGYPVETVLAEKITTMVALGDLNTRDRDWADVWRLIGIHDVGGHDVEAALNRTAAHRDVPLRSLSAVTGALPGLRQGPYAAWRRRQSLDAHGYPVNFADVVKHVIEFADLPLAGLAAARNWSAISRSWEPPCEDA
ncbi:MAG TPA: nucleotidyl transferase AbiEii/AbiGii toxin family protein [Pseudonocardiaceae bacterium]|jgi:predicted nucleotidyltransferase component of viral defense system|nr:nucleotidyl transferase AbiEii/AbiGii toxin family protein [Pseudonocardiaceae bacterium]